MKITEFYLFFVYAFVLSKNCHGFDSNEIFLLSQNNNQILFEHPLSKKIMDDIELIKFILPDVSEKRMLSEAKPMLQKVINREYAGLIENLAMDDDIMCGMKLAAVQRVLESELKNGTGIVEQQYVNTIMGMIKTEVEQKRKLNQQKKPSG